MAPQPHYPYEFHQTDALTFPLSGFDAIHASPPCQRFSRMSNCSPGTAEKYPDLIEPVRTLLEGSGLPYVIENVVGAPLIEPVTLCGTSFGMRIRRHRLFESNVPITSPPCRHDEFVNLNPHWNEGCNRMYAEFGRVPAEGIYRQEMGVGWMNRYEGRQAIPPAYTEHIGGFLIEALASARAA